MTTPHITNGKEYQLQPISTDQRLIIAEVSRLIFGVKSTTKLLVAQGKFPNPLTLSPTIKVSINQSLIEWIEGQTKNSYQISTALKQSEGLGGI
jgi:hypothetical protein